MRAAGISAGSLLEALRKVKVTPVFTAHPTEITRHTIRLKRRRIAAYLEHLDQLPLPDSEAREYESLILAEITALWQTDEVRLNKPTVRDEIHMGLDYFPIVLFETLPRLFAELEESLRDVYGDYAEPSRLRTLSDPCLSAFGSWIGGDRDGNPFVTAASTREALDMARQVIIDHYIAETTRLIGQLSMSTRRIAVSPALAQRVRIYDETFGEKYSRWKQITAAELYRHFLEFLIARLRFTRKSSKHEHAYKSPQQFEEDLSPHPRQSCRQPRTAPGGTRLASSAQGAHFRLPPARARHSPACQRAVASPRGTGVRSQATRKSNSASLRTLRPVGRASRDLPRHRRTKENSLPGSNPQFRHQQYPVRT